MKYIKYVGKTTSQPKSIYKAEGYSYKEVYKNLIEKYGYDIFDNDYYERFILQLNNENVSKYIIDASENLIDMNKYDEFFYQENTKTILNDIDYKHLIEFNEATLYYHDFEIEEN